MGSVRAGLQRDGDFERLWPAMLGELQLVEKKINGGNPAVPGNDEIGTSVCRRLTRAARYPLDPTAIAHFLRLGYWLISKVRVSSLDRARDSIDLVAASVDSSFGIVEHAIFPEDFVNCRAPTRRAVFTEDVVKIAGQQGRYAVGHGCCFSSLDHVALALMYPTPRGNGEDNSAAVQLSSISAAARLPTFLSAVSRPRSSSGLSSENTLFICPECFRKAEAMRSLPREVRVTIRTRRSSALSTRLTRPFATRRSTAVLIEPGVRLTIGPIVLTGKGPLCSRSSSTPKSERPSPVSSIPAAAYLVRARIAFIITIQTWSVP